MTPTYLLYRLAKRLCKASPSHKISLVFDEVFLCIAVVLVCAKFLSEYFGFDIRLFFLCSLLIQGSRCIEIPFAFLSDALDKTRGCPEESNTSVATRIELSILVYFELLLNYSLIYTFLPISHWKVGNMCMEQMVVQNVVDQGNTLTALNSLYYSVVTATTLGYGDIQPVTNMAKFLSISEVLSSMVIIVISIAVYSINRHNDN